MKYIIYFLLIITFVFCSKRQILIPQPPNDIIQDSRKNFLECITNSENVSEDLKNYAKECLKSDLKEPLSFYKSKLLESERDAIKKCRKEMFTTKKRTNPRIIRGGIFKNHY